VRAVQSIDTNVLVRLLVRDDEEQCQRAEALFRRILADGGVWISQIVVIEAVWVLRAAYKFERASIASVLRKLIASEGITVEEETLARTGLTAFENGEADFADYIILGSAQRQNALPLWTFDRQLADADGAEQVP
jgi:predicted nucleic-acid-binding protein